MHEFLDNVSEYANNSSSPEVKNEVVEWLGDYSRIAFRETYGE